MPRCIAHNARGEPCKQSAISGGTVCYSHGGRAPQTQARAAVRAEVMRWGLGDATADPGETLLRLLTQSAARADRYADEIERMVSEEPTLAAALTGDAIGEFGKTGEYVRAMAQLENEERDRCANFAVKAIAAGLAERQVRLAERQGALIADVLRRVFDDPSLGLDEKQRRIADQVAARQLRLLAPAS